MRKRFIKIPPTQEAYLTAAVLWPYYRLVGDTKSRVMVVSMALSLLRQQCLKPIEKLLGDEVQRSESRAFVTNDFGSLSVVSWRGSVPSILIDELVIVDPIPAHEEPRRYDIDYFQYSLMHRPTPDGRVTIAAACHEEFYRELVAR